MKQRLIQDFRNRNRNRNKNIIKIYIILLKCKQKEKKETPVEETGLKEVDPIERAEKDFFKIVEEEKTKRRRKMVKF